MPSPKPYYPEPEYLIAGSGKTVTQDKDPIPITSRMLMPDYEFPDGGIAQHIYTFLDNKRWVIPGGLTKNKRRRPDTVITDEDARRFFYQQHQMAEHLMDTGRYVHAQAIFNF